MRPPLLATALLFILTLGPSLWAVGRDRRPDTPLPTTARLSESTWSHVPAMVLENDYLRAVVIPRSGRLVSCYDKFSRRELLSEAGVAFTFGQNLPPGRPLSWRLTADGDASVSVWVGVTDASTGARWAVEYRLPSDLAGLYTIVRADNAGPDPLETGWSLAAAPATTPAGRMIRVAAGVHPPPATAGPSRAITIPTPILASMRFSCFTWTQPWTSAQRLSSFPTIPPSSCPDSAASGSCSGSQCTAWASQPGWRPTWPAALPSATRTWRRAGAVFAFSTGCGW
ncbi:DUF5107 domain-containing protein [bacterium]|nr:DUF5107 domain-containing protein [bacterium]